MYKHYLRELFLESERSESGHPHDQRTKTPPVIFLLTQQQRTDLSFLCLVKRLFHT